MQWQKGRFLKEFSTFGIGGPIHLFQEIKTIENMQEALLFCRAQKLPFLIVGKGSNCLFDSKGFDGAVLLNRIDHCSSQEGQVRVGAGFLFSLLGIQSAKNGYGGLEFASGIPATVGGAIWMNAGANGQETNKFLKTVAFVDEEGRLQSYSKEELFFGYRASSFQKMKGAIVEAVFHLPINPNARQLQIELVERRIKTQPLKEKNVGCVFRNPSATCSAGALIDACGLKGFRVGDACVSEIHANFIVNRGEALSEEVEKLIAIIQQKVYEEKKIHLEPEVRVIKNGFWNGF